jgi:hypothetical protein
MEENKISTTNYYLLIALLLFFFILYFFRENLFEYYSKIKEKIYEFFIRQYIKRGTIQTTKILENSHLADFLKTIGLYKLTL